MSHDQFQPTIENSVWNKFPDYIAVSIVMRNGTNNTSSDIIKQEMTTNDIDKDLISQHLLSWADAFRAFGAKHKKTPSSAAALIKRYEKTGEIPAINPFVDIYNQISVDFGIPIGGEDISKYVGLPTLKISDGTEPFEVKKSGETITEFPKPGEVIWCDDQGVTCRRWNWRQGPRTAIDTSTKDCWFILEALPPYTEQFLVNAVNELVSLLKSVSPNATFSAEIITNERVRILSFDC
ncbi:MAG: phenylalanine--tRNA ligase beta subunit-related protein [Emcibacteraceae bacterium]|nr:phenylalanine--tRNA ligase beta subunit-related protein [Emcibacteraceae bacterium]MDG1857645.1 phenylalanine--tRNA ligase beta subunit-related protein [Emcibacteraceae bacterium]